MALRTGHLAAMGVLVGGHVFAIGPERLLPWLYATIASGCGLILLEAYPTWRWCLEVRGMLVIAKLFATCLVPWFWHYRVPILIAVVVLGSVGSHMPRRFRHASLLQFPVLQPDNRAR
jgi:hypothetical protein